MSTYPSPWVGGAVRRCLGSMFSGSGGGLSVTIPAAPRSAVRNAITVPDFTMSRITVDPPSWEMEATWVAEDDGDGGLAAHLGELLHQPARLRIPNQQLVGLVDHDHDPRRSRAGIDAAPPPPRWPLVSVHAASDAGDAWDGQFYTDGIEGWMAKIDADPVNGGMRLDESFFPHGDAFRGLRVHQIRLQGGDASSDSYCFR